MREFRRAHHRIIGGLLQALDSGFLESTRCYFGGGTCISLLLDEYRESRDIDLLCADTDGFRRLRETVTSESLGDILQQPLTLAREVRADRDGIRTFVRTGDAITKLEIVRESRIPLQADLRSPFAVPVLSHDCLVAEKLLANADRGADDSTQARDVIDLAYLTVRRGVRGLAPGLTVARQAYGQVVLRELRRSLDHLAKDRRFAAASVSSLGIEDTQPLRRGLTALRAFARRS